MRVEHLVRIIREDENWLTLPRDEARELYDALHAEFGDRGQPRDLAATESDVMSLRGLMATTEMVIPFTAPVNETGPTLADDIEAMIAKNVADVDTSAKPVDETTESVDEADEHEAEFLSRLPVVENGAFTGIREVPKSVVPASDTSEPMCQTSEEQKEEPAPKKTGRPRTLQTDEARALDLYTRYRERFPQETPTRTVSRIPGHYPSPRPSTDEVRRWLRAYGCDIPDPMTRAEVVAQARAIRAASHPGTEFRPRPAEAPKPSIEDVNAPMPLAGVGPEATVQLIHALARSARRRWPEDEKSIRLHIEDLGPLTQLRTVSDAAIALFDGVNRAWLDAYTDLPPFKQRDVDSALLAGWKKVAA